MEECDRGIDNFPSSTMIILGERDLGYSGNDVMCAWIGFISGVATSSFLRANLGVTIHCVALPIFKIPQMSAPVYRTSIRNKENLKQYVYLV